MARDLSTSLRQIDASSKIISRDEIRKNLVGENINNTQYFSKETEVFNEFVHQANEAMKENYSCIFLDATHISPASRRKIISRLTPPDDAQLYVYTMQTSFEECMERNTRRKGFAFVPESAMRRMNNQFVIPTRDEFEASWNPFKETIIQAILR